MEQEINDMTRELRMSQNELASFQTKEKQANIARKSVISQLSAHKKQSDTLQKELDFQNMNLKKLNKMNESLIKKSRTSQTLLEKTQNDHRMIHNDFNAFHQILLSFKQKSGKKFDSNSEINSVKSMSIDIESKCKLK